LSYVSKAILIVHDFLHRLLESLCPEKQVRDMLWTDHLVDHLVILYQKAMRHAHFLLDIESRSSPCTFNHYFNSTLQGKRNDRMSKPLTKRGEKHQCFDEPVIRVSMIKDYVTNKSNEDQACEDIFDALASYYRVARKRFVDNVCQQVIFHMLLQSKDGPVNFFSPELIMGLSAEELDAIAGEDEETKVNRQALGRDVENLEAALKVLRV
jgi:Dynamin GTPase effector domain